MDGNRTFASQITDMTEKIIILDFGSQYTQLIARSLRELNVYCEILPYTKDVPHDDSIRGVILSGSPFSTLDATSPEINVAAILQRFPCLGICFGAQLTARIMGGQVARSDKREYGRAMLQIVVADAPIFEQVPEESQVWMSHGDSITDLPTHARLLARTEDIPVAAYEIESEGKQVFIGMQFHPEVAHSEYGKKMIENFLKQYCGCQFSWTPARFVTETIEDLKDQIKDQKILMALSGGVDSTVAAGLIHEAVGDQLTCIFVDNGLLRLNEYEQVLESYQGFGFNVKGVDARQRFYAALAGVSNPEEKRKIIGGLFIDIFEEEALKIKDVKFLGQGTIYPDVIESVSVAGPSVTIKSHHNVGGLPERMNLELVEPLRMLFKDEVREVGKEIDIPQDILMRHPFPGPGLAIRVLSDITPEKIEILQKADDIYIKELRRTGLYDEVWQAATILLPVKSVGVMGDERTYEFTIALRAVSSRDGMTADWVHLPYDFLAKTSNEIINNVKGINRVVYDISSKPPATIEWE